MALIVALALGSVREVQAAASTAPAPSPAASAVPPALMSAQAAQWNQDIIINADLFSNKPEIMSGGLGFVSHGRGAGSARRALGGCLVCLTGQQSVNGGVLPFQHADGRRSCTSPHNLSQV